MGIRRWFVLFKKKIVLKYYLEILVPSLNSMPRGERVTPSPAWPELWRHSWHAAVILSMVVDCENQ